MARYIDPDDPSDTSNFNTSTDELGEHDTFREQWLRSSESLGQALLTLQEDAEEARGFDIPIDFNEEDMLDVETFDDLKDNPAAVRQIFEAGKEGFIYNYLLIQDDMTKLSEDEVRDLLLNVLDQSESEADELTESSEAMDAILDGFINQDFFLGDFYFDGTYRVGQGLATFADNLSSSTFDSLDTASDIGSERDAMDEISQEDSVDARKAIFRSRSGTDELLFPADYWVDLSMYRWAEDNDDEENLDLSEWNNDEPFDTMINDSDVMDSLAENETLLDVLFTSVEGVSILSDSEDAVDKIANSSDAVDSIEDNWVAKDYEDGDTPPEVALYLIEIKAGGGGGADAEGDSFDDDGEPGGDTSFGDAEVTGGEEGFENGDDGDCGTVDSSASTVYEIDSDDCGGGEGGEGNEGGGDGGNGAYLKAIVTNTDESSITVNVGEEGENASQGEAGEDGSAKIWIPSQLA